MKLILPDGFFTYFAAFAAQQENGTNFRTIYFVCVNLLSYGGGLGYGWSSPALPKLSGRVHPEDNPLRHPTSVHEESWIASLLSLGAMISPIFAELLCEKIGRKRTLLLFSLPMLIGNFMMIFAHRVFHFYVARFLIGLTEGCIFATIPVYSAEISEKHNRGTLGAIMLLFVSLGHLTSSIVGPRVSIRTLSIISLMPCILFLLIFGLLVPETPYFYVLVNKVDEGKNCLRKLRMRDDVDEEMDDIVKAVMELRSAEDKNALKELLTNKYSVKAFILALVLMLLQQFTGLIYVVDYTQHIFDFARTPLSGDVAVILVSTVQVLSIATSANIIDRVNRKTLLLVSLIIIFLLQTTMGSFFYLQQETFEDLRSVSWIPIVCLMLFIMAFQMGIGPISYIFPAEILEPNVKSLGTTLVISIGLLGEFGIATLFPMVAVRIGYYIPFVIFACLSGFAVFFVMWFLPETRQKSFLEIQENIRNKSS
ncbi:facilitated trehalose transporter Tret1 isoform X1 [Dendroctonus ponderosae]|uniref:Major facilitator superfamily (MFS) profile domain-containing protein n=1 Tax=Dendroctonus ponderosae TaxID=77166 RepID=A0AAR5PBR4_DENPD|nr:facilitated trehalose transporter Tret1 isoform X1 [Dendroctonus ponderosae]